MSIRVNILIVDDDSSKASRIREVVSEVLGTDSVLATVAATVSNAMAALRSESYDLMVLDLQVPMRSGEEARRDGGISLLRALGGPVQVRRPRHIVGLTAFEELRSEFKGEFDDTSWCILQYDHKSEEWADRLAKKVAYIAASSDRASVHGYKTDLAIVTALERIELEAVLDLPAQWERFQIERDESLYHRGRIRGSSREVSVVATACMDMGMVAAAAQSMKMIEVFQPRYLCNVGIAAGVKGRYGDILIADKSWDYGSGKSLSTNGGEATFFPAPEMIPIEFGLKAQLSYFSRNSAVLSKIRSAWNGDDGGGPITARIGPVVSGAAVVADRSMVEEIVDDQHRRVIGLEMETYGVFLAAMYARQPKPSAFSVKSICDYADSAKDDRFQRFAAFTSAQFLFHFASEMLAGA